MKIYRKVKLQVENKNEGLLFSTFQRKYLPAHQREKCMWISSNFTYPLLFKISALYLHTSILTYMFLKFIFNYIQWNLPLLVYSSECNAYIDLQNHHHNETIEQFHHRSKSSLMLPLPSLIPISPLLPKNNWSVLHCNSFAFSRMPYK